MDAAVGECFTAEPGSGGFLLGPGFCAPVPGAFDDGRLGLSRVAVGCAQRGLTVCFLLL